MRIREIIVETAEEDRAIISLADTIYQYLQQYADQELDYDETGVIHLGKIGDLFDTPITAFDRIRIELTSDADLTSRFHGQSSPKNSYIGQWDLENNAIAFNSDFLSNEHMRGVIAHELRHAMDDMKSNYKANLSNRYRTAKNPIHRSNADQAYRAQPAEINARFIQVLDYLLPQIKKLSAQYPTTFRGRLNTQLLKAFDMFQIEDLFPEKTQNPQYQRLLKRAWNFIDKVIKHESEPDSNNL